MLIGLFWLSVTAIDFVKINSMKDNCGIVNAKVTDGNFPDKFDFNITVRYKVDGEAYTHDFRCGDHRYSKGDTVEVYYRIDSPGKSPRISMEVDRLSGIAGLVFLLLGAFAASTANPRVRNFLAKLQGRG